MKFFEVNNPYYALIKAEDVVKAMREYVKVVADDDGTLSEEIRSVDRDYSIARYSRVKSEDGKEMSLMEILNDLNSDENMVLIVDGVLA